MRTEIHKIYRGYHGIQKYACKLKLQCGGQAYPSRILLVRVRNVRKHVIVPKEPLMQTLLFNLPLEIVACNLFGLEKTTYIADYVEVQKLASIISTNIITTLKAVFSR